MSAWRPCRGRQRSRGFTLIEVLIASAIAIASMGLIMQLFASGLDRLNRVSLAAAHLVAERELVSHMMTVNPAQTDAGEGRVARHDYRWQARQLAPFSALSPDLGTANERQVALFEIDVVITRSDGRETTLSLTRLGWRDP